MFEGTDLVRALCADESGSALPSELGQWTFVGQAVIDGDGSDEAEARDLISDHGFCCFRAGE